MALTVSSAAPTGPLSVGSANGGLQGASSPVGSGGGAQSLQPTTAPAYGQTLTTPPKNTALVSPAVSAPINSGSSTDANAAAAAAQAAQLRNQISGLIDTVKNIYNSRYGVIDQAAADQANNLDQRFNTESGQLTDQIGQQNDQAGAAYAGNGVYDSSYRGNSTDQITKAGDQQIQGLGQDLQSNLAQIGQWDASQKAGFDAGKAGVDQISQQIGSETDPTNLVTLRNQIDNQIATLQGSGADNATTAQALSTLQQIVPSAPQAQQLQVTLQSILGGNADPTTKAAIGGQLIAAANISPEDQSKLLQAFHTDLATTTQ